MPIPRAVTVVLDGPKVLVMKRYRRRASAAECWMCEKNGWAGPECPGHEYAVLPGGHVEPGESLEETAVRELREETSLTGRVERVLWTGHHHDRPATYFLMADVAGEPRVAGPEALKDGPDNRFELAWATVDDLDRLGIHPAEITDRLAPFLKDA